MRYIFPAPQRDTCAEFYAWRFQRCVVCWWMGDVVPGLYIVFERSYGMLIVDGVGYDRGLPEWLRAYGLCKERETE